MRILVPTLALAISFLTPSFADDATQVFDSLYGQRIKAAKASADRADDHALATELLTAAGNSTDTPALLALLCEASYDLSSKHADGFATAAQAMTLLAESVEAQRTGAREKLVDVLMKQSRLGKVDEREAAGEQLIDTLLAMGDEKMEMKKWTDAMGEYRRAQTIAAPKKSPKLETIKAKLELASRRDRSEKQIARLNEKLLADANDSATAEEIVKLYVVEFDDPKSALPFLNRVKDEQLKKLVPLAAKAVGDLDTDSCLALGELYRSLVGNGRSASEAILLDRSSRYLARFIEQYAGDDIHRKKAELLQAEIAKLISELPATASGQSSEGAKDGGNSVAVWRTAMELGYPLHAPEKDTLPDELEVKMRPGVIQITGTCRHDAGHFFNQLCGHFGKIVTIPGQSISGSFKVTRAYRAGNTVHFVVLVDKNNKTANHVLRPDVDVTYSFRVRRVGDKVTIVIASPKEKVLEASMPVDEFQSIGFGVSVREPGVDKADFTISWK